VSLRPLDLSFLLLKSSLTQEEARIASVEPLKVTHIVDAKVMGVDDRVEDVGREVQVARGDVQDVGDDVQGVERRVQVIHGNVQDVSNKVLIAGCRALAATKRYFKLGSRRR
jgi:hypothetical protein